MVARLPLVCGLYRSRETQILFYQYAKKLHTYLARLNMCNLGNSWTQQITLLAFVIAMSVTIC
jgi:hypothetical protein